LIERILKLNKLIQNNNKESFQLADIKVEIIRSSRRKRLTIEIDSYGVKARAPHKMSTKVIQQFAQQKEKWIRQHLLAQPKPTPKLELSNGAILKFLNQPISLRVLQNQRGAVALKGDQIVVPVIQTSRPIVDSMKDKLIRWYKQQALSLLEAKVTHYAEQMEITLSKTMKVKVRDYKRRWGSCDEKKNLSFNWRIIMAPEEVLDYVVVHELAHLIEFNHSKQFWLIVESTLLDWRKRQDWLHQYGGELYRF